MDWRPAHFDLEIVKDRLNHLSWSQAVGGLVLTYSLWQIIKVRISVRVCCHPSLCSQQLKDLDNWILRSHRQYSRYLSWLLGVAGALKHRPFTGPWYAQFTGLPSIYVRIAGYKAHWVHEKHLR